jgi:hypothetical protein
VARNWQVWHDVKVRETDKCRRGVCAGKKQCWSQEKRWNSWFRVSRDRN